MSNTNPFKKIINRSTIDNPAFRHEKQVKITLTTKESDTKKIIKDNKSEYLVLETFILIKTYSYIQYGIPGFHNNRHLYT